MDYVFVSLIALAILGLVIHKWLRPQAAAAWAAVRPAPAAAAAAAPAAAGNMARVITSVMLAVVAAVAVGSILFGASWKDPRFATLFHWALANWLAVLLIWGCAEALIALNSASLGQARPVLQWMIRGLVLLIFVIAGIGSYFETTPAQARSAVAAAQAKADAAARICPDATSSEQSCIIDTNGSNWIQIAEETRDWQKKLCHTRGIASDRKQVGGVTLFHFWTHEGTRKIKYQLVTLDTDCSLVGY